MVFKPSAASLWSFCLPYELSSVAHRSLKLQCGYAVYKNLSVYPLVYLMYSWKGEHRGGHPHRKQQNLFPERFQILCGNGLKIPIPSWSCQMSSWRKISELKVCKVFSVVKQHVIPALPHYCFAFKSWNLSKRSWGYHFVFTHFLTFCEINSRYDHLCKK